MATIREKALSANYLLEDSASDGNIGGEGALLVYIKSLNSLGGGLEAYFTRQELNSETKDIICATLSLG